MVCFLRFWLLRCLEIGDESLGFSSEMQYEKHGKKTPSLWRNIGDSGTVKLSVPNPPAYAGECSPRLLF